MSRAFDVLLLSMLALVSAQLVRRSRVVIQGRTRDPVRDALDTWEGEGGAVDPAARTRPAVERRADGGAR
jgi:hypothetical protein